MNQNDGSRDEYLGVFLFRFMQFSVVIVTFIIQPCHCFRLNVCFDSLTYQATYRSVADIYIFAVGLETYDDDLQPLTAGTGGQHYFRLRDNTNLHETFDEIIGKLSLKMMTKHCLNLRVFEH